MIWQSLKTKDDKAWDQGEYPNPGRTKEKDSVQPMPQLGIWIKMVKTAAQDLM